MVGRCEEVLRVPLDLYRLLDFRKIYIIRYIYICSLLEFLEFLYISSDSLHLDKQDFL